MVSGIPYSLLPKPVMRGILEASRRAISEGGEGGLFVGYQYSKMLRPHLLDVFGNVMGMVTMAVAARALRR